MRASKRLWALALSLLFLIGAGKSVQLHLQTRTLLQRKIPASIGMGDSLRTMAEGLERELADRLAYVAPERRDPLALRRVVRVPLPPGKADELAEAGRMRLSATLVSEGNSIAIIKYQGKSHTLRMGDTLDQRVVKSIDKRTVVLDFLGKSVVLVNEPAPKSEIQTEGGKRRLEDLQL
jgi:hypothetical protein